MLPDYSYFLLVLLWHQIMFIAKRKHYAICRKGREAFLTMAGVPIHPTGFLVQRDLWKKGDYKKIA